jgi:hypothetical protein
MYERKLRRVLALAARMDSRKSAILARLYREARVEGIDERWPAKIATIAFEAPPFRGGLYEMFEWKNLELYPESFFAEGLAWGLGERLREHRRAR